MTPRLQQLEEELQGLARERGLDAGAVQVLAFLDDVIVATPPELACEVQEAAQRALGAAGLELSPGKTQAWSARSARPDGVDERHWKAEGLTLVGVALGAELPAGGLPDESDARRVDLGTAGFAEQRCGEVVLRATALLQRIAELPTLASPHLPAVQVSALLLRLCGCGKVTHLLRSSPPASTEAAAGVFDAALLEAYVKLAELDPLTDEQAAQCRLPLRLGGRGLRSQQRLAPAAWAASWAQCLPEVLARTGLDELEDLEVCQLPLAGACRAALATLPPPTPDDDELPCWRELALMPCCKLQKSLSRRLDQKNYVDLLRSLDAEGKARLRSCGGPLSSAWQLATPARPSERLEDEDYTLTARALLGQARVPPDRPTCRRKRATGDRAGQLCGAALCVHHPYRCAVGGGTKQRSEAVEAALERIHTECGHHVARQVAVPAWDRFRWRCPGCGSRGLAFAPPVALCGDCGVALETQREEAVLDLEVRGAAVPRQYLDVTVRHSVPGDAARLRSASGHDGAVNREAEVDKRSRYPDGRSPFRVLPIALESFGRFGRTALLHLRSLAKQQAQRLVEGGAEAVSSLVLC